MKYSIKRFGYLSQKEFGKYDRILMESLGIIDDSDGRSLKKFRRERDFNNFKRVFGDIKPNLDQRINRVSKSSIRDINIPSASRNRILEGVSLPGGYPIPNQCFGPNSKKEGKKNQSLYDGHHTLGMSDDHKNYLIDKRRWG